jgi:hypothetical protein
MKSLAEETYRTEMSSRALNDEYIDGPTTNPYQPLPLHHRRIRHAVLEGH